MSKFSSLLMTGAVAIAGASAVLALGGIAQAATVSFGPTTLPLTTTDFNLSLTGLQQFNASLGTLTKVTIAYTGDLSTNGTITNNSATGGLFSSTVNGRLTATIGTKSKLLPNLIYDTGDITLAAAPGPGNSTTFSGTANSTASDMFTTSLGEFIGSGLLPVTCRTSLQQGTFGPGGNASSSNVTQAGCSVAVTYEYTPATAATPEPATLLGLGSVAAMGLLGRKKKSNG